MLERGRVVSRSLPKAMAAARVFAVVASLLPLIAPRPAEACTIPEPPPVLDGAPMDGATDVPIDVVPFYDTRMARILEPSASTFDLADASGAAVGFSLRQQTAGHVELLPAQELAANTEYVLRARSEREELELRFVTGNRRAAPPVKPVAAVTHYRLEGPQSSCSPYPYSSCVSFDSQLPIMVGTTGSPDLWTKPSFHDLSGLDPFGSDECVLLRQRAENGQLSEPTMLCREDGPLRVLTREQDVTCDAAGLAGGKITGSEEVPTGSQEPGSEDSTETRDRTSRGCSLSAPASRSWSSAALGLTALLLLRRSRAPR